MTTVINSKSYKILLEEMDPSQVKLLGSKVGEFLNEYIKQIMSNPKANKQNVLNKIAGAHKNDVIKLMKQLGFDELIPTQGVSEDVLDEISKDTKTSYIHKAFAHGNDLHTQIKNETDPAKKKSLQDKLSKRNQGIMKAVKEGKMNIDEAESRMIQGKHYGGAKSTDNSSDKDDEVEAKEPPKRGRPKAKSFTAFKTDSALFNKWAGIKEEELTLEDFTLEELQEFVISEDFEQLDEVSKALLGRYINKASRNMASHSSADAFAVMNGNPKKADYHASKKFKREDGIKQAVKKIVKESADQPVSITIHHKDSSDKEQGTTVFTAKHAADHEKSIKKAGGHVTKRTLNYESGKKETRSYDKEGNRLS